MSVDRLPPEARLELQISLDRLRAIEEACQDGLVALAEGSLSRPAFLDLIRRHAEAQRAWENRRQRYFADFSTT